MLDDLSFPLPTLSVSQVSAIDSASGFDAKSIVVAWFSQLVIAIRSRNVDAIVDLFVPNGQAYWRDILALTWDLRTFAGTEKIRPFLNDRLAGADMKELEVVHEEHLTLKKPYDDIRWIQFFFKFSVGIDGEANAVVRLVPIFPDANENGVWVWKAHAMLTILEGLKSFPEQTGRFRNIEAYRGNWLEERQREVKAIQAAEISPTVLIIGAGQSGLDVAARLKCLGINTLIIEKEVRIGGNWRARYSALCLHDPVWYDHMPYLPFPATWPVYSPALKMANWLECYAEALDLHVLTSSTVTKATHDDQTGLWTVHVISRQNGQEVELIYKVKHVVFATGFHGGEGKIPQYPGMENFKGQMLHSLQHKDAIDHEGKKVVVVGACTSAHDIAADYSDHGIDVTMFQRSSTYIMSTQHGWEVIMEGIYDENSPPTDIADEITASFPNLMMVEIGRRQVKKIAELDQDLLNGLRKRGFRLNWGYRDAGILLSAWTKAGGYYLDVGASQLIIDGRIKLKNDSQIKEFEPEGIRFEDGSFLPADVVIFATGLGDPRAALGRICGVEALENQISEVYGLDDEGEFHGLYRDMGIPGLWCMMGNMALCRFHSKHIALQIKAQEENVFGERYTK